MIITTNPEFFMLQLGESENGFSQYSSGRNSVQTSHQRRNAPALGMEVYTVDQAAAALHPNVSKSAIYRAIHRRELRARMVGKGYLITEKNLKEFLECQEEENHRAFGSEEMKGFGLFSTVATKSGRDAALTSANKLKRRC